MKDLPLRRSERSFLADQAADAKAAMTGTLRDMNDTLKRVADVRFMCEAASWLAVGWAVAAGFVTGAVLTPAQRKTSTITGSNAEAELQRGCHGQDIPPTKKSLLFSTAVTVLAGILQPVVKSWIAAAVVAKDQPHVETLSPHDSAAEVESND